MFASADDMCRVGLGQGSLAIDHVQFALVAAKTTWSMQALTTPASSPELQPAGVGADKTNASQAQPTGKPSFASAHLAAAATIDELLAKEALANLKRSRATAHAETVKSKATHPGPAGHTRRQTTAVACMDDALHHPCRDGRDLHIPVHRRHGLSVPAATCRRRDVGRRTSQYPRVGGAAAANCCSTVK